MRRYPKRERGVKYVRDWQNFWNEKKYYIDQIDWSNVKTALDIGCGIGMTAFMLQQKGIDVEGTDTPEALENTPVFTDCCNLISLKRHPLKILNNGTKTIYPKKYDILVAQRTEFDREALQPGEMFDYEFFLENAFEYFNEVYIKCNHSGKNGPKISAAIGPYWFNPRITQGLGKPYRAWYLHITKEQWLNTLK